MPAVPPRTPRKANPSKSRLDQRARNAQGLCSHCRSRKLLGSDRCYRHLFIRKLATAGMRAKNFSPNDVVKREQLIARLAMRYNAIRLGLMRPAGGVDEKMLRGDVVFLLKDVGIMGKRIDKKPSITWGGCHGYRKLLDIVRRFDKRAYKEFVRNNEPKPI